MPVLARPPYTSDCPSHPPLRTVRRSASEPAIHWKTPPREIASAVALCEGTDKWSGGTLHTQHTHMNVYIYVCMLRNTHGIILRSEKMPMWFTSKSSYLSYRVLILLNLLSSGLSAVIYSYLPGQFASNLTWNVKDNHKSRTKQKSDFRVAGAG